MNYKQLYENLIISKFAGNLSYAKSFGNLTKTEFHDTAERYNIEPSSIMRLLDTMIEHNVMLKDCKSIDEMKGFKTLLETSYKRP
jgi:hypothetical protein